MENNENVITELGLGVTKRHYQTIENKKLRLKTKGIGTIWQHLL